MSATCQVCVELGRAGIDAPCSICDDKPITLDEVKSALGIGAKEREAAERIARNRRVRSKP